MWLSTSEIGEAQLSSVTEITPKSPSLYVNRSPVWYGIRAGAKAIPYNVNIVLNTFRHFFGSPVAFCAREVLREISVSVDVKSRTTIIIGVFSWMSFPRIIRKFCLNDFRKRSVQLKRYISRHSLRHTFSAVQAKKVPCKFRWKCAVSDSFRSSKFFGGRTHQVIFFLRYLLRLLFAICGVVPDVGFIGQNRLGEDRQSEL